ncbi:hypothetical protein IMSAGC012_01372 [Lachnospiraceae bacterium]|nr:hypothetical protein IMSAGC012_01372 [Lachnospiraceae bacterium]
MAQTFYPAYIPGKWIHYTRHKKKRIRKKYQNRIRREVRRHKVDAQTLSFLLADAAAKYSGRIGYDQPEISRLALLGGSWCSGSAAGHFSMTMPRVTVPSFAQIALPQITLPELELPEIKIPEMPETTEDPLEELRKAFTKVGEVIVEVLRPVVDYLAKVIEKFFKWAGDFWDHLWCENKHWWHMAEHHKKRRIRKKYRNKIKREATRRAGELLELLAADDSEEDEAASDDEEGP